MRKVITILLVLLVSFVSLVPNASAVPAKECGPGNDGERVLDDYGLIWECTHVGFGVFAWVIVGQVDIEFREQTGATGYGWAGFTAVQAAISNGPSGRKVAHGQVYSMLENGYPGVYSAGTLRARVFVQKLSGSTWTTCRVSNWAYNPYASVSWSVQYSMGIVPACGSGYYRATAEAARNVFGVWQNSVTSTAAIYLLNPL